MINYEKAMEILNANSLQLKDEVINTECALNRIAAENIYSPIDLPLFRNSAMDGFALNSSDTIEASLNSIKNFKVDKCLHAGEFINDPYFSENKCIEIMTGAKVPEQFDCVIPVEDVLILDKNLIAINRKVKKNENIRHQGEDITKGELLFLENKLITSEDLMLLSALGIKKIKVKEQVKIAIFSTGNEIIDNFEQELKNGQIYNSNRIYLQNILKEFPLKVDTFPTLSDNITSFQNQINNLIENKYHIIISTGAVSKGKLDLIPDALKALNSDILFHRVNIKPGKPILFAKCNDNVFYFGLPGNPISTVIGFKFFISPFLRTCLSMQREKFLKIKLLSKGKKKKGMKVFYKAKAKINNENLIEGEILNGQESFKIKPLTNANGWIILDENIDEFSKGDECHFVPLNNSALYEVYYD